MEENTVYIDVYTDKVDGSCRVGDKIVSGRYDINFHGSEEKTIKRMIEAGHVNLNILNGLWDFESEFKNENDDWLKNLRHDYPYVITRKEGQAP